jgi:hypothetical protein
VCVCVCVFVCARAPGMVKSMLLRPQPCLLAHLCASACSEVILRLGFSVIILDSRSIASSEA